MINTDYLVKKCKIDSTELEKFSSKELRNLVGYSEYFEINPREIVADYGKTIELIDILAEIKNPNNSYNKMKKRVHNLVLSDDKKDPRTKTIL